MRVPLWQLSCVLLACADRQTTDIGSELASCALDDVDAACAADVVAVTAGASIEAATPVDAGITYEIAGPGSGQRGYVVFVPPRSGSYTLYVGQEQPVRVCDLTATCRSRVVACPALRHASRYDMIEGLRYDIELRPIAAGHQFTLHIAAPLEVMPPPTGVMLSDAQLFGAGTTPRYLSTGDLDSDGVLDLIVSTPDDASGLTTVDLLRGSGTGTFTMVEQVTTSAPGETVASDFGGDSITDIVGLAWDGQGPLPAFYLEGLGDFAYTQTRWGEGRDVTPYLSAGDFDEDGTLEVVAAYADSTTATDTGGFVIVGVPGFAVLDDEAAFGNATWQPIAGDFNGDGDQDVLVANLENGLVRLYTGDGTGSVTFASEQALATTGIVQLAAFDLDDDGISDVVAIDTTGTAVVAFGAATGFSTAQPLDSELVLRGIAAGDFDHDGRLDLAFGSLGGGGIVSIFVATDTGFAPAAQLGVPGGATVWDVLSADFDGDGFADLAATSLDAIAVFLSTR